MPSRKRSLRSSLRSRRGWSVCSTEGPGDGSPRRPRPLVFDYLAARGTLSHTNVEGYAFMEMAYRERWTAEIAAMRRVLAGLGMKEECKWGKPTYTVDGKNIVIMQGFKEYFALGF